jgi:hypothetical protein
MINRGYAYAIRTMGALEMFMEMYAGDHEYQRELNHLLQTLRHRADTMMAPREFSDRKFLLAFADALEEANKPGEYVPLGQR